MRERCNRLQQQHECRIMDEWLDVLRNTNMTLRTLYLWTAEEEHTHVVDDDACTELLFWLQWNRMGRRSMTCASQHPVPVAHLLARAASLPSVLIATLKARPNFLNPSTVANMQR